MIDPPTWVPIAAGTMRAATAAAEPDEDPPGVRAGGLLGFGVSFPELWRRAALFVDRILKGARPADLPVEQPSRFELVVNAKNARELGIAIPASLRLRADQTIED